MIDLGYTRERMLEDIGSPPARAAQARDVVVVDGLVDPRARASFVESATARLVTRIVAPQDILPSLDEALTARFAAVAPELVRRNLLRPLKKALGNAHKRGNRLDPDKVIALEVVVTSAGAFLEVSDQGEGFDVAATCARFKEGSRFFTHGGSGFRIFEKARALISFDDGGRTLRARFLVEEQARKGR